MNSTLESAVRRLRDLSAREEEQLAAMLPGIVRDIRRAAVLSEDLRDPDYRAYVNGELDSAAEDEAAGRLTPLEDAARSLTDAYRRRHGL